MKNHFTKNNKSLGFTLIEIMVAVSIFAIVMVIAVGAILSVVSADKKAQALNSVITNLNFALEGMMRDLRTGYDYDCDLTSSGTLDDCSGSPVPAGDAVMFTSSQSGNKKVTYSLVKDGSGNGAIYKTVEGDTPYSITAPEVSVEKLSFYVTGTANSSPQGQGNQDARQPKILIVIQGKYLGFGQVANFTIQTLVSQRKLDI